MHNRGYNVQMVIPMTPMVKKLLIINIGIWLLFQVIIEQYFLDSQWITLHFSLIPGAVIEKFFIWQPATYMFLHSLDVMHIVMNMLMLWLFGAELETRWGPRFFLTYYLVSGIGAAFIYVLAVLAYYLITGRPGTMVTPVVGASGAVYGLLLAYGIIFSERIVHFMLIFPMRAKYFAMILGAILIVVLLNNGVEGSREAHLCHLGGIIAGFLFLRIYAFSQARARKRATKKSGGKGKLRLVVNNDDEPDGDQGPKYWN